MLELYQPRPKLGVPNLSPFCLKVETFLKMANLPYKVVPTADPRKGPKGKIPFYLDPNNLNKLTGDSAFIIKQIEHDYQIDLEANLSSEQKAVAIMASHMCEEHLYWAMVHSRWFETNNWTTIKKIFFGFLPLGLSSIAANQARNQVKQYLHSHGIGRHTDKEIYQLGQQDIQAIATYLGDNKYFFGDEVSKVDATIYAFLCNIISVPLESPLKDYSMRFPNLLKYCHRMQARFFPETKAS